MPVFEVVSGGDRRSLIKRFERKSKHDAISELVDFHLLNCTRIEKLEAELAELRARVVVIPDECPHLILFDDAEVKPIMFAGSGARKAALAKWEQVSIGWNAHLFVRLEKNCRDDIYPSLSGKAVSEGLLRRIASDPARGAAYADLVELRTLLDDGTEIRGNVGSPDA